MTVEQRIRNVVKPLASAALFTVSALCPAPTNAVANLSRTNAVSSATMTVLLLTA